MYRTKPKRTPKKLDSRFLLRLVILALFFSAGVILGQVCSARMSGSSVKELDRYLSGYFSLEKSGGTSARALVSALVIYFRYPMLAFFLGFTSLGLVLLPVLTAADGFFLSFSVCSFAAAYGKDGVLLALAVFGIRCLITIPCYLALAVPALEASASLAAMSFGRGKHTAVVVYGSADWLRLCVAVLFLLAGVVSELFVSPYLLRLALAHIFT